MRHIIELEDGSIGRVLHMYDAKGNETADRSAAEAIVAELATGLVIHGEVLHPEGLHPIQ